MRSKPSSSAKFGLSFFEKKLTPNLALMLGFERIHHHGLGKAFTLSLGVDFPGTEHEGTSRGIGGTQVNLFHLFHRSWDMPTWVYSDEEELAKCFDDCETLLRRVLPAVERRFLENFSTVPDKLPEDVPIRGALTVREALPLAKAAAQAWSDDVRLLSVNSTSQLAIRETEGAGVGCDGRLQPHGGWTFRFQSARHDGLCYAVVPHTGETELQVWPEAQHQERPIAEDFADSPEVIAHALPRIEEAASAPVYDMLLNLPATANPERLHRWGIHCICTNKEMPSRHDVFVQCDAKTGEVLDVTKR